MGMGTADPHKAGDKAAHLEALVPHPAEPLVAVVMAQHPEEVATAGAQHLEAGATAGARQRVGRRVERRDLAAALAARRPYR